MKHISTKLNREFVCFLHYIGLDNISFGISLNWHCPNIEIHLPFCFIKIGWQATYSWQEREDTVRTFGWHTFGRK